MRVTLLIPAIACILMCGCNRANEAASVGTPVADRDDAVRRDNATAPVTPVPSQTPATVQDAAHKGRPLTHSELKALLQVLVVHESDTEEVKKRKIDKVIALLPQLKAAGLFWTKAGAIPTSHQDLFRNEVLTELRALRPTPGKPVDRWFREAHSVAKRLREPEVARIALEHLPLVAVYRFPSTPPPEGWPRADADGVERLAHGDQGILASTVVELGDPQTLAKFRELIKTVEPDTQRTLIWALGRSTEMEDFELLMQLRGSLVKPEAEDTLLRALNRIPQEMETAGNYPESVPQHRAKNTEELLKNAAECKARLAAKGLVVELSFYD